MWPTAAANHWRLGLYSGWEFGVPLIENKSVNSNIHWHMICSTQIGFTLIFMRSTLLQFATSVLLLRAGIACWQELLTRDRKVASLNPSRSGRRIFFSRVNFVCWLLFGVCSTPVLPQWHVKDPGHSAKSAGDRFHLKHAYIFDPMKSEWAYYAAV